MYTNLLVYSLQTILILIFWNNLLMSLTMGCKIEKIGMYQKKTFLPDYF